MTFEHPSILLLLLVLLAWATYSFRGTRRKWGLCLKIASLMLIVLALSNPSLVAPETKTATVVLVDTSNSIRADDLKRATSFVGAAASEKGRNWMRVIPFARHTRNLQPDEASGQFHLQPASYAASGGTDIEAALNEGLAAIPAGYIPRAVLISDGNENEGSTARALAQLARLHVPVDTVPLAGRSENSLRLLSVSMPAQAYAGEQIPIDLTIESPSKLRAPVSMSAEGKALGQDLAELKKGMNFVRVHARVESQGAAAISGVIHGGSAGDLGFERAVNLKRVRVLYLSQDPPGSDNNLLQAFKEADVDVVTTPATLRTGLNEIQLVILNNLDLDAIAPDNKARLEEYVNGGGGVLLIGGERQVYRADRTPDALDRVLPAKLVPPQTPEGVCVALIIDKSSSMEGRKIELARLSAIGVVDHLRPTDSIGILIFDNSFQWAVPMRRAVDKAQIKRMISGISPDGGTQIAPALTEAYRRVALSNAGSKHIVLLTDGISEEGDSLELSREALRHQVTISTVGLGQDVNRSYLEKVAAASGGKSYFLNDPQGLEQILLKDVQDYSEKTTIEKELVPIVKEKAEILDGVHMESAPALRGYARFSAKPGAETVLGINVEKKDPLYVRWQYGLGRAGVFTSDAKSRWAAAWVTWPGFDKFWMNVTRDLLSHEGQTEAHAELDPASNELTVTYRFAAEAAAPATVPPLYVLGPNGFEKPVEVSRISDRFYRGRVPVPRTPGLFRVRPVNESGVFPEVGVYAEDQEARDHGVNEQLLKTLASGTGGRFDPEPASIFDASGRTLYVTWELWPLALGLAIAASMAELIARKWGGIRRH
jgi:Ca-activated chloride channel homolog